MVTVKVYPLALAKILRHSAAFSGIEVAGVLIGKLIGDVVEISDSDTGPQIGTSGHVKLASTVAPIIAEKLEKEGRGEYIVGWYHSHPGFGCFLSHIDVETQVGLQKMFPQCVALVIDPNDFIISGRPSDAKVEMFQVQEDKVITLKYEITLEKDKIIRNFIEYLERNKELYSIDLDKIRLEIYEGNRRLEEKIRNTTEKIEQIYEQIRNISNIINQNKQTKLNTHE
ncbi:MAG: Mov34/MPN/PAD-1 family protein [Candidatus Jordarchaeaceae archaeon]